MTSTQRRQVKPAVAAVSATRAARPRPPRRRRPNWALAGLGVAAAGALVALVLLVAFGSRGDSIVAYASDTAEPLVEESNALGEQLAQLLARPADHERGEELTRDLESWAEKARRLVDDAEAIEPPAALRGTHGELIGVLALRASGFEGYAKSIGFASDQGEDSGLLLPVLVESNRDFLAADRLYLQYADAVQATLNAEPAADVELPKSVYFPAPASGDEPATEAFAQALTGEALASDRNVALLSVSLEPAPIAFDDDVQKIVGGSDFEVSATVKNVGEKIEEEVALKVTLRKKGAPDSQAQTVTAEIADLEPGDSESVVFTKLEPTEGANRLTVSVGPLPDEVDENDNVQTIDIDYMT